MPEGAKYEGLAGAIEHTPLASDWKKADVATGRTLTKQYGVAALIVRSCDIDGAVPPGRRIGTSQTAAILDEWIAMPAKPNETVSA